MDTEKFINDWLTVSNAYDTEKYLEFYLDNAILDDRSVGKKFIGKKGIEDYFVSYFIGYKTKSRKVKLAIKDQQHAYLEVEFTGEFPEGKLGGSFELSFNNDKISFITADLLS